MPSTLRVHRERPALGVTRQGCMACGCDAVWLDFDGDYRCLMCSRVRATRQAPTPSVEIELLFSARQYVARKQRVYT